MMAATVASASASVVDQLLTLMRMAALPCQVVPPIQAVPPACTRCDDGAGVVVGIPAGAWREAHQHLVEDDVVEDLDPGASASRSAIPWAIAQQRSTRSRTPFRPRERSVA